MGEDPLEAAERELYEESGAAEYALSALWDYDFHHETGSNHGRAYLADIARFDPLPSSEMESIGFFDDLPEDFTYDKGEQCAHMACALSGTMPKSWAR